MAHPGLNRFDVRPRRDQRRRVVVPQVVKREPVEVRGSNRPNGYLIVRADDPLDSWYVLLVGPFLNGPDPYMTLVGGIKGRDAQQDRWLRDPHGWGPLLDGAAIRADPAATGLHRRQSVGRERIDTMTTHSRPRLIAGDDYLTEAWVYGDDPQHKITVKVRRADDDNRTPHYFALHPDQAVDLAHRLLTLAYQAGAEIAE